MMHKVPFIVAERVKEAATAAAAPAVWRVGGDAPRIVAR